jgi:hypothetical protein
MLCIPGFHYVIRSKSNSFKNVGFGNVPWECKMQNLNLAIFGLFYLFGVLDFVTQDLLSLQVNMEYIYDFHKVEKILKGSLDSIPSPSVKIQIMGGKVCLRSKSKTMLGMATNFSVFKSLLTSPSNVLPYYLKYVSCQ